MRQKAEPQLAAAPCPKAAASAAVAAMTLFFMIPFPAKNNGHAPLYAARVGCDASGKDGRGAAGRRPRGEQVVGTCDSRIDDGDRVRCGLRMRRRDDRHDEIGGGDAKRAMEIVAGIGGRAGVLRAPPPSSDEKPGIPPPRPRPGDPRPERTETATP